MYRIAGLLALVLLTPSQVYSQSLYSQSPYASTPGVFIAAGTFKIQEYPQNDVALGAEGGYRLGNGFDLSLGVRHATSEVNEFDFGFESSTWEIRPAVAYRHLLGPQTAVQVRGLLNTRFYDQTSGGFDGRVRTVENRRLDADLSAVLFYRVRLGDRLDILPGAGLYDVRTLSDKTNAPCVAPEGDNVYCSLVGYDFSVRSTGAQFELPVALRLGKRSLVFSPTLRYALSDTYQILERVVDVSLRFNF